MLDMSTTIAAKSSQLNADDLMGGPITVKITNVFATNGDQPIAINYEGDGGKPYLPCKSMRRVLVHVWGNDGKSYIGRSMTLYRDPSVKYGGIEVGGIRISHMTDVNGQITMALTGQRGAKKSYVVKQLVSKGLSADSLNALKIAATAAAHNGPDALKSWFSGLGREDKAMIKPILNEYKALSESYKEKDSDGLPTDQEDAVSFDDDREEEIPV